MRIAPSFHLLLVPAALLAAACEDAPSPQEPPGAVEGISTLEGTPERPEAGAALVRDGGHWADGYLSASNPLTPSYLPAASYSFNRSGGVMVMTKPEGTTGRYVATFYGLSSVLGAKSTVHVTGFTNGAISSREDTYCKPLTDHLVSDRVEVRCFRIGTGVPVNATFTLLVTRNYADLAFASAHQPTGTNYSPAAAGSWNPAGTTKVIRNAVGQYRVLFNNLGAQLPGVFGHVQVNAVGTGKAHCNGYNSGTIGSDVFVDVRCYTPAGAPLDAKFSVLYLLPSEHMAYAWADKPLIASYSPLPYYSWNPAGGVISIARRAVGSYRVEWAGVDPMIYDKGDVQVTSYGGNAQCKATFFQDSAVHVLCFTPSGMPVDSRFAVLIHS